MPGPKTRSAAIAALLVAALLALAGCGGGDSGAETTEAGSTAGSAQGEAEGKGTTPSAASAPAEGNPQGKGKGKPQTPQGSLPPAPGQGTKQGERIVLPEGAPEPGPTPAEREGATLADISLTSPTLQGSIGEVAALPAPYTCDGKDSWPELRWSGIPQGTEEIALFLMASQPVDGKLFFNWALAAIDPTTESIEAGQLPRGAVQGRNGFGESGYSVCPPSGTSETYIFVLFAIPQRLSAAKGFDPAELRQRALEASGNAGLLAVSYGR